MKKYLSMLIFTLIGAGVGFFAGERVGEKIGKKNKKECCGHCLTVTEEEPEERPDEKILKDEGYVNTTDGKALKNGVCVDITDEMMADAIAETNAYLADFEHPEEEEDDIPEDHVKPKPEGDHFIEIVDVDAWEAEQDFSKVDLFYYEEDEIVCDEDEHRLEDYEELIGNEALNTFGENLLNPSDCVYIRNTWTECIYQVTRIHNAYGRIVLGIEDEYPL